MSAESLSSLDLTDEQRAALEAARCLARAGVPIFVAPPVSNDPTGFGLPKRWQDTRPGEHSLAAVDRWRPGWALCAVMGHVVDAVDVDPRHGGSESQQQLAVENAWPGNPVATARTPSGGWHMFVPALGVGSRDGVRPGLDVKGGRLDGTGRGFVFLAPTERPSKVAGEVAAYRWTAPPAQDVAASLIPDDGAARRFADVVRGALEHRAAPSATVHDLESAREAREHAGPIPDGERHAALVSYAGRLRARGLSYDEAEVLYLRRFADCAQPPAARYPVTQAEALDKLRDVFGRYPAGEPAPEPTVLALANGTTPAGGEADGEADGEPTRSSWARVDLGPYLDGTHVAPTPTLLPRPDGVCLLYRGLVHSLHGESESGKSWVAQAECARVLVETADRVLYVDFESDPGALVERLLALGVPPAVLAERFDYRRPEASPRAAHELQAWQDMLAGTYALAVVDGVTDSLGLFGAKTTDNDDIAAWLRLFPRRLAARTTAAVVLIDHVTKDADTRGRFAIGGQAKLAGLDGAAYVVDVVQPLGRGLRGVLTLRVAKDRPGTVRGRSGPMRKGDRTQEAARFVLDATDDRLVAAVEAPDMSEDRPAPLRPTALMEKVSRYVEASPGVTGTTIERTVSGKTDYVRAALSLLVEEGYVRFDEVPHGSSVWRHHTIVRPYRAAEDGVTPPVTVLPEALSQGPAQPRPNPALTPPGAGLRDTSANPAPRPLPIGAGAGLAGAAGIEGEDNPARGSRCVQCGRPESHHSNGQWSTCETCGLVWHQWGPGGVHRCPACSPGAPS